MSTEWRAYVRVDNGRVIVEMDPQAHAELSEALTGWLNVDFANLAKLGYDAFSADGPVIIRARSDETTLPGVRR